MAFITFSFNYWQYPFLMSIFQFMQSLTGGNNLKLNNVLLIPMMNSFSHLFAIIPDNIRNYITLRESNSIHLEEMMKQKHLRAITVKAFTAPTNNTDLPQIRLILLLVLGITNSFSHGIYMVYTNFQNSEYSSIHSYISICLTNLLCHYYLKTKLYRHHYLSLALFTLVIVLYYGLKWNGFIEYIYNYQDYHNYYSFFIYLFLYIIPTCFREITEKVVLEKYFITVSRIMLYEGLFALIVYIILFIIVQFIDCNSITYFNNECEAVQWRKASFEFVLLFNYRSIKTLYVWGYIIATYLCNLFRLITIHKLSPTHRYVSEMILQFYFIVESLCIGSTTVRLLPYFFSMIVLLFACFIFNEFIIIRVCDLHYNTLEEIALRSEEDSRITLRYQNEPLLNDDNQSNELALIE